MNTVARTEDLPEYGTNDDDDAHIQESDLLGQLLRSVTAALARGMLVALETEKGVDAAESALIKHLCEYRFLPSKFAHFEYGSLEHGIVAVAYSNDEAEMNNIDASGHWLIIDPTTGVVS